MSKKLLLADDSITIQKVIQITFAHEDYELTITDNGDAALAKAQEIKPDLVMTDIYMPGKNGYELTAAIKQNPALQHIPVLLLAGSFEPFDEDKARSCKADAWIEKPFESQNLIDKVAELLSAAPKVPEAPVLAAEPEPFAAVAETSFEEMPLAAFDEPVAAEPEMAVTSEDPFGDISFEDELPDVEPEPIAAADDWSDVIAESAVVEPAAQTTFTADEPVEDFAADFSFAEEAPVEDLAEDFSFAEEGPVAATEALPVADVDLDVFDMGDDEIMPLDDDDILGAEDLEPAMPEQTLAAWSRSETEAGDGFAEPFEETAFEGEAAFVAPIEEPAFAEEASFVADDETALGVAQAFEEPVTEPFFAEAPTPATEEFAPAAVVASAADVEAKASAMSEEDIEKIIEKIVVQVVEKLAGSILERVAWDVVPDLAENLIREEIRKIKDAAA